jgi:hypothetical protein
MRSIPLVPATASAKAFQESIALKWMDLAAAPGRYNVTKLIEQYGDAWLPDLLTVLADCPKARSQSIHDRCKAVYGRDSRWSTPDKIKPA